MADFEVPETHEFPIIPTIMEGAMSHSAPYLANAEFQQDLGFPGDGKLIDGWKETFLNKLAEMA